MNDDVSTALKVLAALGGASLLIWIGIVLVKSAKRGGNGLQGIVAAPPVAEAQDGRTRKGTHSGDPPS